MAAPGIPNWQRVLANMVGVPYTPAVHTFFTDWQRAEGGNAANDPFNTTEPGFGATGNYNHVGVKNYDSPAHGLQATAATLKNGRYGNILAALHGSNPMVMAQALANSPWGTGSLVEKILGSGAGSSKGRMPVSDAGHAGSTPAPAATVGSATQAALAQLIMGSGKIDFNSNQIQAPNLMALAQLRQTSSAGASPTAPRTASGRALPPTSHVRAGVPVAALTSIGGQHPTEGLPGYPAHDYFAPAGTPVVAPISGKVVKLSGHDPKLGPIEGPHGPLGWSVYIQGTDGHTYYLTHMGSRNVRLGETLKAGTPIGTVANYAQYGTPSHIHMGVH